jgi:hypothetical protein
MSGFACLAYDVPLTERGVYNKLRNRIRRVGIPMTMSVYLIPIGLRGTVQAILAELQSVKPGVISSKIIKFDPSEEKELAQMAERGLSKIISDAHKSMMKRLSEAETEHKTVTESIELTLKNKNRKTTDQELSRLRDAADDQFEIETKKALSMADKSLKDATALSVAFCLTNQMEYAIAEAQTLIDHRRELMKAQDKVAKISTAATPVAIK